MKIMKTDKKEKEIVNVKYFNTKMTKPISNNRNVLFIFFLLRDLFLYLSYLFFSSPFLMKLELIKKKKKGILSDNIKIFWSCEDL